METNNKGIAGLHEQLYKKALQKPAHLFRCNRVFYFSEVNDFSCSHDDCVVAVTRGKGQVMEYYDDGTLLMEPF